MKKIIDILIYILTIVTSLIIICTFLTTYQFYYVSQIFNSYRPLQLGVSATMAALALRFVFDKSINNRIFYAIISIIISISLLYFALNWVR